MLRNSSMERTWKIWVLCLATASFVTTQADNDTSVTADQANGTWKTKGGEFKIWALGKQRLQIEFSGVYEYETPQGPTVNEGEGSGITTIEGDTCHLQTRRRGNGMSNHSEIYRRQTCGYPNWHLRIGPQRERSRHLQKSFRQETEVRLGLTSVRGFVRPKLDSHDPVA
jgi:hypothetical protein